MRGLNCNVLGLEKTLYYVIMAAKVKYVVYKSGIIFKCLEQFIYMHILPSNKGIRYVVLSVSYYSH